MVLTKANHMIFSPHHRRWSDFCVQKNLKSFKNETIAIEVFGLFLEQCKCCLESSDPSVTDRVGISGNLHPAKGASDRHHGWAPINVAAAHSSHGINSPGWCIKRSRRVHSATRYREPWSRRTRQSESSPTNFMADGRGRELLRTGLIP